jgi:hypothetical protein
MNPSAIKRMEIVNSLALVSDDDLDKIKAFVNGLLSEAAHPKPANRSLEGIWKDKGFEKIVELEAEIAEVRRQESPSTR